MTDQKPGAALDAMLLALPIRPENLTALSAIRREVDALAMTTEHQREGCARATRAGLIGQAFYGSDPKDKERHARVTSYAKDTAA